jgi:hypothetical protein
LLLPFSLDVSPILGKSISVAKYPTALSLISGGQLVADARHDTDAGGRFPHAQQPTCGHRFLGTLDLNQLRFAQGRSALNKSGRPPAEHHVAAGVIGAPHLLQNRESGDSSVPHDPHRNSVAVMPSPSI